MAEQKGGKQNNGNKHANQFTQGRNDDRGRKENEKQQQEENKDMQQDQ